MTSTFDFNASATRTIQHEATAVSSLVDQLGEVFNHACSLIFKCKGKVIVTGMGKSGHIGKKIAATLASTGTPAFFVHPGEASHGDMGMMTADDVVIALSNSGESAEVVTILPLIKRLGLPLISISATADSTLALAADAPLTTGVKTEACPLNLAPTSSTTAQLVLGDAMAIALLEAKGFSAEDFAFSHPGGSLGRRLLLKVSDVMHTGDDIPTVSLNTSVRDTLLTMTSKRLGFAIVQTQGKLEGVFTDGDLRRILDTTQNIHALSIDEVMTRNCRSVTANLLAAECVKIMDTTGISALPVVDANQQVVGALNLHDLMKAGVM